MEIVKIVLEYIKVLLWPTVISGGVFLFRHEIRDVLSGLKNISEMKISSNSLSLKAKIADKIIKSKVKASGHSETSNTDSLFSILINLPDQDIQFLENIKRNLSFLPTTSNDRNRYNSLCNHGLFSLSENGAFLPTQLGQALIKEIDREF